MRPVESEHDLPFAGLEQLFRPVHRALERLPDPQGAALRVAFGLSSGRLEDRLLLGLATLSLLAEAADDAPLLCLVDDLQWLDRPSSEALLFAARRLVAEGVVMLFAVRDDPADWFEAPGLCQLTLAPLAEPAAREVVTVRRGAALRQAAQRQLLRQAGGNPLALLELPVQDGAGGEATGIEAAFRGRVLRLPLQTRRLLLLAAAMETEEAGRWSELARLADVPPTARRAAVDATLISEVDAIVFRHPLVRSAVYNTSSPTERAEAHRVLASDATEPLSRAWHLAAAARDPDERLAGELAEAASAAVRRGAFASAAGIFVRAADLSTDSGGRARRLIAAAQAYLDAGDADASSKVAEEALVGVRAVSDQAALTAVQSGLELQRGTPGAAYEMLVTAAHALAREDPARAFELQAQAIAAAFVAGWPDRAFAVAQQLVRDLPPAGSPYEQLVRESLEAMAATQLDGNHTYKLTFTPPAANPTLPVTGSLPPTVNNGQGNPLGFWSINIYQLDSTEAAAPFISQASVLNTAYSAANIPVTAVDTATNTITVEASGWGPLIQSSPILFGSTAAQYGLTPGIPYYVATKPTQRTDPNTQPTTYSFQVSKTWQQPLSPGASVPIQGNGGNPGPIVHVTNPGGAVNLQWGPIQPVSQLGSQQLTSGKLVKNADGSVTIWFGPKLPSEAPATNWIPTPSTAYFSNVYPGQTIPTQVRALIRIYYPTPGSKKQASILPPPPGRKGTTYIFPAVQEVS